MVVRRQINCNSQFMREFGFVPGAETAEEHDLVSSPNVSLIEFPCPGAWMANIYSSNPRAVIVPVYGFFAFCSRASGNIPIDVTIGKWWLLSTRSFSDVGIRATSVLGAMQQTRGFSGVGDSSILVISSQQPDTDKQQAYGGNISGEPVRPAVLLQGGLA